ncbi:MAG: hypothetical protein AAGJ10_13820 [Bacteroidota bacterium]
MNIPADGLGVAPEQVAAVVGVLVPVLHEHLTAPLLSEIEALRENNRYMAREMRRMRTQMQRLSDEKEAYVSITEAGRLLGYKRTQVNALVAELSSPRQGGSCTAAHAIMIYTKGKSGRFVRWTGQGVKRVRVSELREAIEKERGL